MSNLFYQPVAERAYDAGLNQDSTFNTILKYAPIVKNEFISVSVK